tara:strand:- start:2420 stop:3418 length:999 start_codon:yes stop_codon:yes gene_type:complete
MVKINGNKKASLILVMLMVTTFLSGCIGSDDDEMVIKIAFSVQDDYDNPEMNPQSLADFISNQTGLEVELYAISSDGMALEALRFGHADIAFLDGGSAWLGWQNYGLDVIAADQKSDGSTYYVPQAWVLNNSSIQTLDELSGTDSCHTGWLKSAGMLMPMGYMIGEGIVEVTGDDNEIDSLLSTIENHFGNATIPSSGDLYYGYDGAFRCMTEGKGDVAFAKSTSFEDHCVGNDWCLVRSEYRMLEPAFGQVPSHAIMVNPSHSSNVKIASITAALLALNSDDSGSAILENVLNTPGITATGSQEHLGSYSSALNNIPGLTMVYEEKYEQNV